MSSPARGDRILDYSTGNFEAPVGGNPILAQGAKPLGRDCVTDAQPRKGRQILDYSTGNFEAPVGGDRMLTQGVSPGKRLRNRCPAPQGASGWKPPYRAGSVECASPGYRISTAERSPSGAKEIYLLPVSAKILFANGGLKKLFKMKEASITRTCTDLIVHAVFSTKERKILLENAFKKCLWAYLGGIVRELGGKAIIINSTSNHVHLLIQLPPTRSVADCLRIIKTNSSRWINERLRLRIPVLPGSPVMARSAASVVLISGQFTNTFLCKKIIIVNSPFRRNCLSC